MRAGPVTVAGRLARSATFENAADAQGRPGEAIRKMYVALARGGAPWIVSGYAYVLPNGRSAATQSGIHSDELVGPWRQIAEAVHQERAETRLFMQIVHGGRQACPLISSASRSRLRPSRSAAESARAR